MALCNELALVIGDNSRRFLPAMLECMQAEDGQRAGVRVAENTEYTTLLVQRVRIKFAIARQADHGLPLPLLPVVSMSLSNA